MATELTLICQKNTKEKSWKSDKRGNPLNRCTVEFSVEWILTAEDSVKENPYEGSTLSLNTYNEKEADRFKIGKKYTLELKSE